VVTRKFLSTCARPSTMQGKRLQLKDAAINDDLESLKKYVGNDFGSVLSGLQAAIPAKSSKSVEYLLHHGINMMKGGEMASKQCEELVTAITAAVCGTSGDRILAEAKMESKLSPIENVKGAIEDIKQGKFVVVQDAASRENEGDLIIAAEKVTPEKMAFMVNYTSGIICVGITSERCKELKLPQMVEANTESHQTAFTVSIDYKHGTTTGISAGDRAKTILAMTEKNTKPTDFARPGHIFPLRAKKGGVLIRPGHTETSVDLARMAGLYPAGVLSEIVNRDGSMQRTPQLRQFSKKFGLRMVTIEEIIEYRKATETKA